MGTGRVLWVFLLLVGCAQGHSCPKERVIRPYVHVTLPRGVPRERIASRVDVGHVPGWRVAELQGMAKDGTLGQASQLCHFWLAETPWNQPMAVACTVIACKRGDLWEAVESIALVQDAAQVRRLRTMCRAYDVHLGEVEGDFASW